MTGQTNVMRSSDHAKNSRYWGATTQPLFKTIPAHTPCMRSPMQASHEPLTPAHTSPSLLPPMVPHELPTFLLLSYQQSNG